MATILPSYLNDIRNARPGQAVSIRPDLDLFRVPKQRFRNGQSYALYHDDHIVLVDAVHAITRDAVRDRLNGRRVSALLLTHSDLLGQAFGKPAELSEWLGGAPVLINSYDTLGYDGLHPIESNTPLLEDLGIAYHHVPGHTPGSTAYLHLPTGYLFTGDIIVGNNYEKAEQHFTHAPIADTDWALNKAGWQGIPEAGVKAVLPLHGQPSFGKDAFQRARAAGLDRGRLMRE
jgi:glyoxylase-like metal-dependent hydrolase (beta-lactamase superfamily II)